MKNKSVGRVILNTIKEKWLLTAGIVITVVGAIVMALFPPLILAKIIDTITSDTIPAFWTQNLSRYTILEQRLKCSKLSASLAKTSLRKL